MKKLILLLLLIIGTLSSNAQEVIVTESGDTLVALRHSEVNTINKAFLDLKYTKLELEMADSSIVHLRNSVVLSDSIISMKDEQLGVLKKEIKREKNNRIKTMIFSGGIGALVGLIVGILL